ncbi:hypothetical protein P3T39_001736 [Kitasatospora sp. GP82]|nr:hypothetical protein [Kitasatospora sp. GP82]
MSAEPGPAGPGEQPPVPTPCTAPVGGWDDGDQAGLQYLAPGELMRRPALTPEEWTDRELDPQEYERRADLLRRVHDANRSTQQSTQQGTYPA